MAKNKRSGRRPQAQHVAKSSPSQHDKRKRLTKRNEDRHRTTEAKAFTAQFSLAGDSLKRPPQGIPADHPAIDDLKRKDFIAVSHLIEADILDPNLPKTINKRLKTAAPFMQFLCSSQGLLY